MIIIKKIFINSNSSTILFHVLNHGMNCLVTSSPFVIHCFNIKAIFHCKSIIYLIAVGMVHPLAFQCCIQNCFCNKSLQVHYALNFGTHSENNVFASFWYFHELINTMSSKLTWKSNFFSIL